VVAAPPLRLGTVCMRKGRVCCRTEGEAAGQRGSTPETIAGAARALITNAWCLASPWMPAIPCPLRSTRPPPPRPHRPRARLPWPHHRTELASARATSLQGRFVWLGLLLLPNGTCAFSTISPVAKSRISRCARLSPSSTPAYRLGPLLETRTPHACAPLARAQPTCACTDDREAILPVRPG
jgi:hypothetical protein